MTPIVKLLGLYLAQGRAELRSKVLPEILVDYPGMFYSFEGQAAEQRDTMGGLQRGFAFALLMIYALLAVPLRSYTQQLR